MLLWGILLTLFVTLPIVVVVSIMYSEKKKRKADHEKYKDLL